MARKKLTLGELYEAMTPEQRVALAAKAGCKPAHLWQIANKWDGRRPSIDLIKRLSEADSRLDAGMLVSEFANASEAAQ